MTGGDREEDVEGTPWPEGVRKRADRKRPDVTVVIPTYNRADFVGRAVASALDQPEGLMVEVRVVDDGSTDRTREALRPFGEEIRIIAFGENQGRNVARNAGRLEAAGDWVKFLDSDDMLEPGALRDEVNAGAAAGADIVVTSWRSSGADGDSLDVHEVAGFARGVDSILAGEAVPTSAALYKRCFIGDVPWDTGLKKLDDWEYFTRAFLKGARLARLPRVSYTWVSHEGQGVRQSSLFENAREHHTILGRIEERLRESGSLTLDRRKRLAQYYYKELRVLSLHDRAAFESAAEHIRELDDGFRPRDEERQWWMRCLAAVFGFRSAVLLHTAVKRAFKPGTA